MTMTNSRFSNPMDLKKKTKKIQPLVFTFLSNLFSFHTSHKRKKQNTNDEKLNIIQIPEPRARKFFRRDICAKTLRKISTQAWNYLKLEYRSSQATLEKSFKLSLLLSSLLPPLIADSCAKNNSVSSIASPKIGSTVSGSNKNPEDVPLVCVMVDKTSDAKYESISFVLSLDVLAFRATQLPARALSFGPHGFPCK